MAEEKETPVEETPKETITIHQFIVHEVYWEEKASGKIANMNPRKEVNDIDSMSQQVAQELGNLFNQTSLAAGMFASEKPTKEGELPKDPTVFENHLGTYLQEDLTFSDFVEFTQRCAKNFTEKFFGKKKNALPGYLLFFQHSFHEKHYLSVVMLHKTKGMTLNKHLDLTESEQLDLSTLHLAARISLTTWRDEDRFADERYIRFKTGRKTAEVRAFFADFIGCDEYLETKTDTSNLINAVEAQCDELGYDFETKGAKLQQTKEYCIDPLNLDEEGRVHLEPLSKAIFPEHHDAFVALAQSDQFGLSEVIGIHRQTLNKGMRLSGKSDKLSISFTRDALQDDLEFIPESEDLVIKNIPANLLAILKEGTDKQTDDTQKD